MNEQQYRTLIQQGLPSAVGSPQDGPSWEEVRSYKVADRERRQVRRLPALLVVIAIAVGLLGANLFANLFRSPPPPSSSSSQYVYLAGPSHIAVIDVAEGAITEHAGGVAPGDPPHFLVRRGDLLLYYGRTPSGTGVFRFDPSRPDDRQLLDEAWFFLPSAHEDRVWLAQLDMSQPDARRIGAVVEMQADGTRTSDPIKPPEGRWPLAHVESGFIFLSDGEDLRLELWNPESRRFESELPGVIVVATWGDRVVTRTLDNTVYLVDLAAATARTLLLPEDIVAIAEGAAFSGDGEHVALIGHYDSASIQPSASLVLVDFASGASRVAPGTRSSVGSGRTVVWSANNSRLFLYTGHGDSGTGELISFAIADERADTVPVELGTRYFGVSAR